MSSAEQFDSLRQIPVQPPHTEPATTEPRHVDLFCQVPAEAREIASMRHAMMKFADACGMSKAVQDDVALAVTEACTNVVLHAYVDDAAQGLLTVACSHHDGELVVAVRDEGRGMTPRPESPGLGLGLSIIGRLARRLEISDNIATGTEVQMTFAATAAKVTTPGGLSSRDLREADRVRGTL